MRRKRLLLVLALGIAGAILVMRRRPSTPTTPERHLPPPIVKPPSRRDFVSRIPPTLLQQAQTVFAVPAQGTYYHRVSEGAA